ncbi:NlpC/P60 family protein [Ruminococcaceae bacterium OttesenSCG-928-A16]|nr:NlpC/P60 family protein [Ruminococcaceae bacterium OttesenSCG-928-A16]
MGLASVFADIAPLYVGPSAEGMRSDEALYGMTVQVIKEEADFSLVRTEYGTEGYTPTKLLGTNAEIATAWKKYKKKVVLAPYIDVQKAPAAAAQVLANVPRGGLLVALGAPNNSGWQKVGLPTGTTGYTRASYLGEVILDWTQISPADMRWNLVETALAYNGTATRAGGRTPFGIDGVGLVAMSYLINGVVIGRESFVKPGSPLHTIPASSMDEGDIIYFDTTAGMYMGDDRFVYVSETPGTEGVIVGSLNPQHDDYRADLATQIAAVGSLF